MLTVLTQGPPFLSGNWASARDASSAFGQAIRLIARHPLMRCIDRVKHSAIPWMAANNIWVTHLRTSVLSIMVAGSWHRSHHDSSSGMRLRLMTRGRLRCMDNRCVNRS